MQRPTLASHGLVYVPCPVSRPNSRSGCSHAATASSPKPARGEAHGGGRQGASDACAVYWASYPDGARLDVVDVCEPLLRHHPLGAREDADLRHRTNPPATCVQRCDYEPYEELSRSVHHRGVHRKQWMRSLGAGRRRALPRGEGAGRCGKCASSHPGRSNGCEGYVARRACTLRASAPLAFLPRPRMSLCSCSRAPTAGTAALTPPAIRHVRCVTWRALHEQRAMLRVSAGAHAP